MISSIAGAVMATNVLTGRIPPEEESTVFPKGTCASTKRNPLGQSPSFWVSSFSTMSVKPLYLPVRFVPPLATS
jgi:hypothetical protein